jgi:hypothetical protein
VKRKRGCLLLTNLLEVGVVLGNDVLQLDTLDWSFIHTIQIIVVLLEIRVQKSCAQTECRLFDLDPVLSIETICLEDVTFHSLN